MNLWNWIWTKKVDSVEEFIRLAQDSNNLQISAVCTIEAEDAVQSHTVGTIGTFSYILVLTASGGFGRRIKTSVVLTTRFGSANGFSDRRERLEANTQAYLKSDEIIRQIEARIPTIQLTIIAPNGQVGTRQAWNDIISGMRVIRDSQVKE